MATHTLGDTAIRQLRDDHDMLRGMVWALQQQAAGRRPRQSYNEPFRIAYADGAISGESATTVGTGTAWCYYRERATDSLQESAMKNVPVFNAGPMIEDGATIFIQQDGWGDYWVLPSGATVCVKLEITSPTPDVPAFGCVTINDTSWTDDIVDGSPVPIQDHNAVAYSRLGFRFHDGVAHYKVRGLDTGGRNPWLGYANLFLNGAQPLTTAEPLGTGYTAAECPAWGLLYPGYDRNDAAEQSIDYFDRTWGPIYFGDDDPRNVDGLWPGLPGFRLVGYPEEFEQSPGVYRWRARFRRDPCLQLAMQAYGPTVYTGTLNDEGSEFTARAVKKMVNYETYDGSDATHPLVEMTLRHPACWGPHRTNDFNVEELDRVLVEIDTNWEPATEATVLVPLRHLDAVGAGGRRGVELIDARIRSIVNYSRYDPLTIKGWALADGRQNAEPSGTGQDLFPIQWGGDWEDANAPFIYPYERIQN